MRPVIGNMVGAGIFALPFVFWQAGLLVGVIELVIIAIANNLILQAYSRLAVKHHDRSNFSTVIGDYLGPKLRPLSVVIYCVMLWGGMLAYVLFGGQFIVNLLGLGQESLWICQFIFAVGLAPFIVGGEFFVNRLQGILLPIFFAAILFLAVAGGAYFDTSNLILIGDSWLAPFGIIMFAINGIACIPELRDVSGGDFDLMKKALNYSTVTVMAIYGVFVTVMIGMLGGDITVDAVSMIGLVDPLLLKIVSFIGLCTLSTAFLSVGSALLGNFLNDFRWRLLPAWLITVSVPFGLWLLGASDIALVLGITGGVLVGAIAGLVLLADGRSGTPEIRPFFRILIGIVLLVAVVAGLLT